jgi:hypothetical protein
MPRTATEIISHNQASSFIWITAFDCSYPSAMDMPYRFNLSV